MFYRQSPSVVAVGSEEGVWTISTLEDPDWQMWSSSGPDIVTAYRPCALEKEAYKILQETDISSHNVKVSVAFQWFALVLTVLLQRLFTHATDDYDIVMELGPAVLPRYRQKSMQTSRYGQRAA